jgi:hypothetical protein
VGMARSTADFGDWHDLPQLRPFDRSPRILDEGEVGPGAVVLPIADWLRPFFGRG